ncbi:MAG: hypothetical protein V1861_04345 [Candidatus Micrarchaeota archaeon]
MAGGKVLSLAAGTSEARRAQKAEPLAEPHAENIDRYPIWVHVPDNAKLAGIFHGLSQELDAHGLKCAKDLQTEPHANLQIVDFFEVFHQGENKRTAEIVGTVSLYRDGEGKTVMKISPHSPGLAHVFRGALTRAIERELGAMAASGSIDLEVVIRQQADYQPYEQGAGEGPRGA